MDLRARQVERPAPRSTVLTRPIEVDGYATVGITWSHDSSVGEDDLAISLSTSDRGRWTDFEPMSFDPDHEPDPGSPEARRTVPDPAPTPWWSARWTPSGYGCGPCAGELPEDLQLAVVDPGVDREMERQQGAALSGGRSRLDASLRATPRRRRC